MPPCRYLEAKKTKKNAEAMRGLCKDCGRPACRLDDTCYARDARCYRCDEYGHYARCCEENDETVRTVRQVKAPLEKKRVRFGDEITKESGGRRLRSLELAKARQDTERDGRREDGRGSRMLLKKYKELMDRVERMAENAEGIRARVRQLEDENKEKTKLIKEMKMANVRAIDDGYERDDDTDTEDEEEAEAEEPEEDAKAEEPETEVPEKPEEAEDEFKRLARTTEAREKVTNIKKVSPCDPDCTNQFWCGSPGCWRQEAAKRRNQKAKKQKRDLKDELEALQNELKDLGTGRRQDVK